MAQNDVEVTVPQPAIAVSPVKAMWFCLIVVHWLKPLSMIPLPEEPQGTTKPTVAFSARNTEQRDADHATRRCGDGVGGS